MKLIKKINNNFALGVDSQGKKVVVSGKGIGFKPIPCDLDDLSCVNRTYYDIDLKYIGLLNETPEEIINLSIQIVDYTKRKLKKELNPNIIFTLADHINFSITRYKKGITFDFPLTYDFQQLYKKEIDIAKYALDLIHRNLHIKLPDGEITGIAMNIVNSELSSGIDTEKIDYEDLITSITSIIEKFFQISVKRDTVNYSRFATHLRYLFVRILNEKTISSDNLKLYKSLLEETPKTYDCVCEIKEYLKKEKNWDLDKEETLYLMLHVNRLFTREDCNLTGITSNT